MLQLIESRWLKYPFQTFGLVIPFSTQGTIGVCVCVCVCVCRVSTCVLLFPESIAKGSSGKSWFQLRKYSYTEQVAPASYIRGR